VEKDLGLLKKKWYMLFQRMQFIKWGGEKEKNKKEKKNEPIFFPN
jgi:hypothetical protein